MPDGLERTIDHQQMADLLAFIHAPDRQLLIEAQQQAQLTASPQVKESQ